MIDEIIELKETIKKANTFLSLLENSGRDLNLFFHLPQNDNVELYVYNELSACLSSITDIWSQVEYIKNKLHLLNYELDKRLIINENQTADKILINSTQNIDWTNEFDIGSIFTKFTSHQYPTMQLGVNNGFLTKFLVAAEPLYLLDFNQESINKALELFNPIYQQRLCKYTLELVNDFPAFGEFQFKENTFGFILCWEFALYFPHRKLIDLINYIHYILKPGGTAVIQFNNCNKKYGADNAKQNRAYYQTFEIIKNHLDYLKITEYKHVDFNESLDWIEFKKPGVLTTVKLQSVLGEIIPKFN